MNYIIPIVCIVGVIVAYVVFTKMSATTTDPTTAPTMGPTVRERLDKLCPMTVSETRNGIVFINPTNGATRDDYLFSGCTAAGTCDQSDVDPVSNNMLKNIPNNCHCGCWDLGDYSWDPANRRWVKKA
jgi:hypothetical protein